MREGPRPRQPQCSHCKKILRKQISQLNSEGNVIRFLPLLQNKTRLESEPATPPFDVMQFLAQHVQGFWAAQSYPLPPPSLVGKGQLCRRIHVAR